MDNNNDCRCSHEGCQVFRDTLRDRMATWWCPTHALRYGSLTEQTREAIEFYIDLPYWVTDLLDIGVHEVAADLYMARQDGGLCDAFRDALCKRARLAGQGPDETNAGNFYCDKIERMLEFAEEKTKVEPMRCTSCGAATSCPGPEAHR